MQQARHALPQLPPPPCAAAGGGVICSVLSRLNTYCACLKMLGLQWGKRINKRTELGGQPTVGAQPSVASAARTVGWACRLPAMPRVSLSLLPSPPPATDLARVLRLPHMRCLLSRCIPLSATASPSTPPCKQPTARAAPVLLPFRELGGHVDVLRAHSEASAPAQACHHAAHAARAEPCDAERGAAKAPAWEEGREELAARSRWDTGAHATRTEPWCTTWGAAKAAREGGGRSRHESEQLLGCEQQCNSMATRGLEEPPTHLRQSRSQTRGPSRRPCR